MRWRKRGGILRVRLCVEIDREREREGWGREREERKLIDYRRYRIFLQIKLNVLFYFSLTPPLAENQFSLEYSLDEFSVEENEK